MKAHSSDITEKQRANESETNTQYETLHIFHHVTSGICQYEQIVIKVSVCEHC